MASVYNIARLYDPLFGFVLSGVRAQAVKIAPPEGGMKILDIGCGTGAQLASYQKENGSVFGIDIAESMLNVARENLGSKAGLTNGNATKMPYPDQTFDLVLSSLFLHQLRAEVRIEVFNEVIRVLHPKGRVLLIDFHPDWSNKLLGRFTRFAISAIELAAGWEHFRNSKDFLSRGGVAELAATHKMRVAEIHTLASGNIGIYLLQQA